jgi:hydrogenase nickel incorporation protein HypA/HybF
MRSTSGTVDAVHEEAVLRDLVRKVNEVASAYPGKKVQRIELWVGALSHITGPQLSARWPTAAASTAAEHARIDVSTSTDLNDPRAQGVVLISVDLEDG